MPLLFCLLCLTFNCFLSFFSQSEALHSSTLCPPYECRCTGGPPSTLHTPHHAVRATHVPGMYLPTHTPPPRCTHTRHIHTWIPICIIMATGSSASAAPAIEIGSIYPTMQELRAAAAKQAGTCVLLVWRCCVVVWDVEDEGGLSVRRHSYWGHRVELWRIVDWPKKHK